MTLLLSLLDGWRGYTSFHPEFFIRVIDTLIYLLISTMLFLVCKLLLVAEPAFCAVIQMFLQNCLGTAFNT